MTEEKVFEIVQECFCEALGVDRDEVELKARIMDDLGAESIDLLDIVFRLERAFDVQIPRGDIEAQARTAAGDEPYEIDGVLTTYGLQKLQEVMPEVDPTAFRAGLTARDIPRLFTVETFYNICLNLCRAKGVLGES